MKTELEKLIEIYKKLGIDQQIDYDKFYLYSIITHSTAIEGSTITELENQIMFDNGISIKGKSIEEQNMNLDLKNAYEKAIQLANNHTPVTTDVLTDLSSLVMKNTGKEYYTALGNFSSSNGELRLLNVTAGVGGKSYMSYNKVPAKLKDFCDNLNNLRANYKTLSIQELYNMSFDAHYKLVTIHPWADGNGRMSRLIMNMLQLEFGLIPTKILTEDKEEYIKILVKTREEEDLSIFREYMTSLMIKNLNRDILLYKQSIGEEETYKTLKRGDKTQERREKIIELLSTNPKITMNALAAEIGISPKTVEKYIGNLKKDGIICRVGADRGGYWQVISMSDNTEE